MYENVIAKAKKQMDDRIGEFEASMLAKIGPTPAQPEARPTGLAGLDNRELITLARRGVISREMYQAEIARRRVAVQKRADDIAADFDAKLVGKRAEMDHRLKQGQERVEISKTEAKSEILKQMADDPESPELYEALLRLNDGDEAAVTADIYKAAGYQPPASTPKVEKRQPYNVCVRPASELRAVKR